jgi:heterodisulfide reductase subunit D
MKADPNSFLRSLDARVADILDACTRCGRCVEVCPMPGPAGIDASKPEAVAAGVLDILRNGEGPEASAQWATACSGSGHCISACNDGINPRFMLAMARRALKKREPPDARREKGKDGFKAMSRGVRVLSRLQLPAELLERLSPSSHPEQAEPPELVFYTGCNMLKTPHIGLLCLDVLDRLGVSYEVYGGPANCCGILQMRPGDDANSGRQSYTTIERFAATKTAEVLSWCPTCQIQFDEVVLPSHADGGAPAFDMTMFAVYLARRLDDLRPHFVHPVNKRVGLHEHPGAPGVADAVKRLFAAIPGLEFVDLALPRLGYTLNSLSTVPEHRRALLAQELKAAEQAGVTTLAGIYHSDHRELCSHESRWSFEIVNFMELVGESMGIRREDSFKRLKLMQDVDAVLADAKDMIAQHGLNPEEVREVVLKDMLGEQILPTDRRAHAAYLD